MDYPRYRLLGLPLTSSLMELAVKQIGRRVKGSEKFWSASGGDEMLSLCADAISDDNRLAKFLQQFAAPTDGTRAYTTAALFTDRDMHRNLEFEQANDRRHRGRRKDCPFANAPCRPPVDVMVRRLRKDTRSTKSNGFACIRQV